MQRTEAQAEPAAARPRTTGDVQQYKMKQQYAKYNKRGDRGHALKSLYKDFAAKNKIEITESDLTYMVEEAAKVTPYMTVDGKKEKSMVMDAEGKRSENASSITQIP